MTLGDIGVQAGTTGTVVAAADEIRTTVTVQGDVSGQLAVGSNIVQMRIDRVVGNVLNVLPAGSMPRIEKRPQPLDLVPRRPAPMFDRDDETAAVVAELVAGHPVQVVGPSGTGKSTFLRHLAHHPPVGEACGGVAHLSARGHSRDDLLQALFTLFYTCDIPVKPAPIELRHHLRRVRAALLLDDVELSDDEVQELEDFAPSCGFVLAGERARPTTWSRAVSLAGLPPDAAAELFAHVLGRALQPEDGPAMDALYGLSGGVPSRLVELGTSAAQFAGVLQEFATAAVTSAPPPVELDSPGDVQVIGLLAALPGLRLDAAQMAAMTGLPDVAHRLDRWVARGLVTASPSPEDDPALTTFALASGIALDPTDWQLDRRRAEVHAYFDAWARAQPDAVLAPGAATETVRTVQLDARHRGLWRSVLALGALLEGAYAVAGHWDAWRDVAQRSLDAARALRDAHAEAHALHQLGTHAVCVGETAVATTLLGQALDLRTALGDTRGAQVTQHNLHLLVAPPVPPGHDRHDTAHDGRSGIERFLERVPMPARVLAVLAPLVGALAFVGAVAAPAPSVQVEPQAMQFAAQPLNRASSAQSITLGNRGGTAVHVDGLGITGGGRDEFTVTGSTCSGTVPAGRSCVTTVVFTPTGPGDRRASLTWDVHETTRDPVSTLTGVGTPDPGPTDPGATGPGTPTVDPRALTFGDQPLNVSSAPQRVEVVAPASGPVDLRSATIDGVQAADFVLDGDSCSGVRLAPRAVCTTTVRFTPTADGARSALLTIPSGDGEDVAAVPLLGTGAPAPAAPVIGVAPRLIDFGDRTVATSSTGQQVVLANRGPAPVSVGGATVVGAQEFATTGYDCPATLAPGADCAVTVVFAPTAVGQRTAQLVIQAPGNPTVPLRGAGTPGPPAAPQLTPGSLTFPETRMGERSPPQTVTLTNEATVPLTLTGVAVSGATAGFEVNGAACTTGAVPAGGSCQMPVTFAPKVAGRHSGVLGLTVEGVSGRPSVVLTGTATGPTTPLVPNLIGLSQADAEQKLRSLDLKPGVVTTAPHPDIAAGAVADQKPRPGVTLTAGGAVDLVVSSGPPTTAVPGCVGKQQTDVEQLLDAAKLRTGGVTRRSDPSEDVGVVLACTPAAGKQVAVGSAVDLVVSSGPPPVKQVPVPDVVDKPLDEAKGLLSDADLVVGRVKQEASSSVPEGSVISSTPDADTEVDPRSAVDLVVSSGAPPKKVKPKVPVPDVSGRTPEDAADALSAVGLKAGQQTLEVSASVPVGSVIRSAPEAGTKVDPGTGVDLVVSAVAVPKVVGHVRAEAEQMLTDAGLTVGTITPDLDHDGDVLSCSPAEGTPVRPGSPVALDVDLG